MKISVVTPSFNQVGLLENTICSVLNQNVSDLDYLVIDGGSSDGSINVIEKYSSRLSYWCSEKDKGQYDAINKGFHRSQGEIMAWLNSSDLYFPWTLRTVFEIFTKYPEVMWISSLKKTCLTDLGNYGSWTTDAFTARRFCSGRMGSATNSNFIQQETCFWRRSLWEKIGSKITDNYRYAGDFWLWSEFFKHANCTGVDVPLAIFRFHNDQRSGEERYRAEVSDILHSVNMNGSHLAMIQGTQNVLREWVPADSGLGGRCDWRIVRHDDDYTEVLSRVSDLQDRIKWNITNAVYPFVLVVRLIYNYLKKLKRR